MAVPSPRVLETATSAPRVDENDNNITNQSPRVGNTTTTTATALDQLQNRLATKSVQNSARSRQLRTNSVQLDQLRNNKLATKPVQNSERSRQVRTNSVKGQSITEEILPHTVGTTIVGKIFKKGTLNGKITSYDKDRQYYIIEYEDGDSEELRHKTVERYIITAETAIDQLQRLTTRSRLQAKTGVQNNKLTMETTTNDLPPNHAMAVFEVKTEKML
jgi:hypothetical protein